jgi:hypothetical protein
MHLWSIFDISHLDEKELGNFYNFIIFYEIIFNHIRLHSDLSLSQSILRLRSLNDLYESIRKPLLPSETSRCQKFFHKSKRNSNAVVKCFKIGKNIGGEIQLLEKHLYRHQSEKLLWDESLGIFSSLVENIDKQLSLKNKTRRLSFIFGSQFFHLKVYQSLRKDYILL